MDQAVVRDLVSGQPAHRAGRVLQQTARHLGHAAALLAPDVVVVFARRLEVAPAIAQVHAHDQAVSLERRQGPEHR